MASSKNTVDFILEQISGSGTVRAKKMFGEYGIYCNEKIVALVCDDQLFIKPTKAGREFINDLIEAPPYPGAKPYFFISGELWDDSDWLTSLVKITASELPLPKKKVSRKIWQNISLSTYLNGLNLVLDKLSNLIHHYL